MILASIAAGAAGTVSAALYLRRRRWPDAALAAAAGGALAAMLALPAGTAPAGAGGTLVLTDSVRELDATTVAEAGRIELRGHGLFDAEWRDLPARPVAWQAPREESILLDFPRTVARGRNFALTVKRADGAGPWRLQLLAENGAVLDQASGSGAQLTVQWLPPLAERLVLRARLQDGAGKTLHEGPVPLVVTEPQPLQVIGRFGAASFDTRVLNELLTDSGAVLDWQTVLGAAVTRTETARAPLTSPNATVVDAAWFERQGGAARAALLAQVAQGMPLLILGGNAAAPAVWQGALGVRLVPQSATTEKEDTRHVTVGGTALALAPAAYNPARDAGTAWQVAAGDDDGKPWLWQRPWRQGRIAWVGVADWHRHAITAPRALAGWWQQVLDRGAQGHTQALTWLLPDPLPLPGLRTELCAHGVKPGVPVTVSGQAPLAWQARSDRAGAACVAFWPRQPGWLTVGSGTAAAAMYVYAAGDWPAWQNGLRQAATQRYIVRPQAPSAKADSGAAGLPRWPAAVLLAASLLALWWRERR